MRRHLHLFDVDDNERTIRIIDEDEARLQEDDVNWVSPIAKAQIQRWVGDIFTLKTPQGEIGLEVIEIAYRDT